MRKIVIATGVILLVLLGGWMTCNISGMYKMYSIPTSANEPAIKVGSKIFATNLKEPKNGDFIIYGHDTISRVHRLIASEGDVLEIKKGRVYINKKDFDKGLSLLHAYILTPNEIEKISAKGLITDKNSFQTSAETYTFLLEDAVANENGISARRIINSEREPDNYISKTFGHPWNKDNFGPYTIPANKLFVMGDNRDNSEDSRYLGCIDKSDVIGVVLK